MHTTVHYLLWSSTLLYSTRYETSPTTRRPSFAIGNIPYYSVSQSTATYSDLLLPTIKYYSVALRTANVLLRTTQHCFVPNTTKHSKVPQSTTPYYKVLQSTAKFHKAQQSTTKHYHVVLLRTSLYCKFLPSATNYHRVSQSTTSTTKCYKVLQCSTKCYIKYHKYCDDVCSKPKQMTCPPECAEQPVRSRTQLRLWRSSVPANGMKRPHTRWSDHDLSMKSQNWTHPVAELTFPPWATNFVQNSISCSGYLPKLQVHIPKYCTCH